MKHTYFVTGISTEVGKTVVAAILTEALEADYWKPIQAGELDCTDTHKVRTLVSNANSVFHTSAYALNAPMSPHAAAQIENTEISVQRIVRPTTQNHLIIEGAGGLLVPLNETETIADLISGTDRIIVVSRHYLGSINHTLLTIEALKRRNLNVFGIIFSGNEHPSTESIVELKSGVPILGRIDEEPHFDTNVIREYANRFRKRLS
ncbi:MAG: dethiobiotin synthase [Flavobacteriaceae bacterium]|nr:dethiobiotin synthase [Flavobacteriaceae bacterium]